MPLKCLQSVWQSICPLASSLVLSLACFDRRSVLHFHLADDSYGDCSRMGQPSVTQSMEESRACNNLSSGWLPHRNYTYRSVLYLSSLLFALLFFFLLFGPFFSLFKTYPSAIIINEPPANQRSKIHCTLSRQLANIRPIPGPVGNGAKKAL